MPCFSRPSPLDISKHDGGGTQIITRSWFDRVFPKRIHMVDGVLIHDRRSEPVSRFSWDSMRSRPHETHAEKIERLRTDVENKIEKLDHKWEAKQADKAAKKERNAEAVEEKRIKRLRAYQRKELNKERKALKKERKAMMKGVDTLADPDRALVLRQLGLD